MGFNCVICKFNYTLTRWKNFVPVSLSDLSIGMEEFTDTTDVSREPLGDLIV